MSIDRGVRPQLIIGKVYRNRGGGEYRCLKQETEDVQFAYYNAVGEPSSTAGVFQNIKSGWSFTAKRIIQYADGTIEWDHSTEGRFEEIKGDYFWNQQ